MEPDPEPSPDPRALRPPAPVVPTPSARVRLRPVGLHGSRITGGLWATRRATNHAMALPHGAAQLERAGNVENFRLAAGGSGSYRGGNDDSGTTAPFLDSDVYKWLEAVGWELAQVPDPGLVALAEPLIDLIARAQRGDGYLDTFFQVARPGAEFTDMEWGHELYVAGHLVQAAVAWKRGLDDDRLLRVAERFVDRIDRELGPGRRELICGHPELEMALVELYRTTGQGRYLELARILVERRGRGLLAKDRFGSRYWQDHEPVRTAVEPVGHAVRQVYLDCGVVDVATETGDRELLDAAIRRWEAMRATRTYLTGALGSRHRDEAIGAPFELPSDRAYAETCASIGSAMLAWRLLLATGEDRFADLIERTALNGILSGFGGDGTRFFYSNPLLRHSAGLEVLEGAATTRRAPWFEVSCCPPNLMRFLATFPDQVATVDGRGIQLHQFATGTLEVRLHDAVVRLDVATGYPWAGDVDITVAESVTGPWTLSMRAPAWCPEATLTLDGSVIATRPGPGTIEVTREWAAGDRLRLSLRMEPRVTSPDPRIDALRGSVALERGPIVYAVEDADLPPGGSVDSLEFHPGTQVRSETGSEPRIGEATRLTFEGLVREDPADITWPYASRPATEPAPRASRRATRVTVRSVPYFSWAERPGLGMRVWVPVGPWDTGDDGESTG
jgi:hypothetical protein